MSVTQVRNSNYVLVGVGTSTTPATSIKGLAEGQIQVFDAAGGTGAIAAGEKFIIAIGGANNKPAFVSEAIDPAKIEMGYARGLESATEQVTNIGYDGAANSITNLEANGYYKVSLYIQEYLTSNTDGRYIKHFQYLAGNTAPTQAAVASELVKSGINNFSREAEDYMKIEMLLSDAGAALGAAADTVVGNEGSKYLVVTDTGADTSVTAVAAGDYIRLGTATTDPVYKVVTGITTAGGTIELEVPLQEDVNLVGNTSEVITAANAATANAGVKLTGKPLSFVVGKKQYKKVRWETIVSEDFEATVVVNAATAFEGIGTYEQASEAEWFARGFEGEYHRMGEPTIYPFSGNAASGTTYDVTTLRWVEDSVVGFQANVSPKQITIYSPNSADYMTESAANGGVWAQIEAADNSSGKLKHRDTGETADSPGLIL